MGKNFKTSAAAAFISGIAKPEPPPEEKPAPIPAPEAAPSPAPVAVAAPKPAPSPAPMPEQDRPEPPTETASEAPRQINGREVVVIYRRPRKGDKVERRTRQAHLLMLPSLYKESQKFAKANGTSFNALVEDALIAYLGTKAKER